VALGDSTAQGLGASHPSADDVGQAHVELRRRTGVAWRVINLSCCGALTHDVLHGRLPCLSGLQAVPADRFHPSDTGYRDWTDAPLSVLPHR
jgi:acyl-CoA thioesterase-1